MKILIKELVKRKPGCIYHIDSEGNVIEELGPAARVHGQEQIKDNRRGQKQKNFSSRNSKLSNDDNIVSPGIGPSFAISAEKIKIPTTIRSKTLKQLLLLFQQLQQTLQLKDSDQGSIGPRILGTKEIMGVLHCSKRTAYDYFYVLKTLRGGE